MEMCRACLTTGDNMAPLDEFFINGYNLLTNLNVLLYDNMPQYSCENCIQTVKYFLDFREKCITSESTLQQVLLEKIKPEENTSELVNVNGADIISIKQEVKIEKTEDISIFGEHYLDNAFADYDTDTVLVKDEGLADVKPKRSKRIKKEKKDKKTKLALKIEKLLAEQEEKPCGLCKKTFKDRESLSKHLELHRNDNRCDICSEMFRNWAGLLAHRVKHLARKEWRRCHLCEKTTTYTDIGLEYHYLTVHFEGEKPKLICKTCLKPYENPRKLRKHIYSAHSSLLFVCDYCTRTFNSKQKLRSHIKTHSDNRSYVCDLCGFSCKQSGGLKLHKIRKHAPTKATCKVCQRLFWSKEDLDKHVCKELDVVCPFCGIQVVGSKRLNRHLESHSEVRRHKCDRCPAVYKTRSALIVHKNRHDGLRTKQCEYCPLKFYSQSVLIKHRRVHTGEKPYVCKICEKGFTGNHNLKVHMKVHGEHLVVKKSKDNEEVTSIFK